MNLNFNKYKRIFAFGCSFTGYSWPTWADLLAFENKEAEYFNYARAGLGNVGISCKLSQAHNTFKFNENDLILVMWSTFCREDRWVNGEWLTYGNVFNSEYDDVWLKKYADPMGYLIRDHAIINITNKFLNSLSCDSLILRSVPLFYTEIESENNETNKIVLKTTYTNYDDMPKPLHTFLNGWDDIEQTTFLEDLVDKPFMRHDNHPKSTDYKDYLLDIGIKLSENVIELAEKADDILKTCKSRTDLIKNFDYLRLRQSINFKQLF